jgi:hypothetical protein
LTLQSNSNIYLNANTNNTTNNIINLQNNGATYGSFNNQNGFTVSSSTYLTLSASTTNFSNSSGSFLGTTQDSYYNVYIYTIGNNNNNNPNPNLSIDAVGTLYLNCNSNNNPNISSSVSTNYNGATLGTSNIINGNSLQTILNNITTSKPVIGLGLSFNNSYYPIIYNYYGCTVSYPNVDGPQTFGNLITLNTGTYIVTIYTQLNAGECSCYVLHVANNSSGGNLTYANIDSNFNFCYNIEVYNYNSFWIWSQYTSSCDGVAIMQIQFY